MQIKQMCQSVRLHDTQENRIIGLVHYDWIIKMHVYTLVKLKSNRIGFLIVGLRPLDYSIIRRTKRAYSRSI